MRALLKAEIIKLRSNRSTLGLVGFVVVLAVAPALIYGLVVSEASALDNWSGIVGITAQFTALVALIFGILGITGEYRYGTITYAYLTSPRRGRFVLLKLGVYAVVGGLLMLLALVVANAVLAGVFAARGFPMPPVGDEIGDYARRVVTAGLMTAFGVALGALVRSQVIAVAGVLVWSFVVETAVAVVAPEVAVYLPFTAFRTVHGGPSGSDVEALTSVAAFGLSVFYIAVVSGAALLTSLRRDVT